MLISLFGKANVVGAALFIPAADERNGDEFTFFFAATPAGGAMTKILALVAGIVLIGFPAWKLKEISIPLPEYRKEGYADYVFLVYELLAVYGSVLFGMAVHVVRTKWSVQSLSPFGLFKAGIGGA
jgi:hypothetical protein